ADRPAFVPKLVVTGQSNGKAVRAALLARSLLAGDPRRRSALGGGVGDAGGHARDLPLRHVTLDSRTLCRRAAPEQQAAGLDRDSHAEPTLSAGKEKGRWRPISLLQSAVADGRPGGHPPALFSGARRRLLQGIHRHVGAPATLGLEADGAPDLGE